MIKKLSFKHHIFIFFLIAFSLNSLYSQDSTLENTNQTPLSIDSQNQPSTIFIHGTLFGLSWLVRLFECPLGLTPAALLANRYVLGRIPYILHQASAQYPIDKSYLWGWHGELSFKARKSSAHKLYHKLQHITGKKRIIGQSHGCNIALNLAKVAQLHKDNNFAIDQLVLLAGPVQEVNSHLVNSPVFKKIFSLYSSDDLIQILDPQGLYEETQRTKSDPKLFSERIFKPAPNLVQAEITMSAGAVSHADFLSEKFLKHLPDIIELLDQATQQQANYEKFHFKVNIPLVGKPQLTEIENKI